MPSSALAFDLTRLITRLRHASPTGIDRVDLAYARRYLAGPGQRFGVVLTPRGMRVLPQEEARRIVEAVADGWTENRTAEADPVYRRLAGLPPLAAAGGATASGALHRRRRQAEALLRTARAGGVDALPAGTVYLHTSHLRLDLPGRFDWLYGRTDIRPVFFVHDLIPITHPEYGRAGEAERHGRRLATVAAHAAHVLVNSRDTGARFDAHCAQAGLRRPPARLAPLGVEPAFLARDAAAPRLARPTFLVCGTIEPRKNHLLLLHVWRALAERLGPATPRLLVIGRRGWEIEHVVDMLDRCTALHGHVEEVRGLTTPGLARLMRGATALLMPSFVEGYGLPVVEAAAAGLPVVASDLPVHREIAGAAAHFLDPLDGPGWRDAVLALSEPASALRRQLAARLDAFRPPSWEAHFETVDAVLDDLGAGPRPSLQP
ncbi:glycosyltransferase family 4 protein [Methylobacterium organophilum]|uniref:glycosyltransferase family 4 protein n=1 Tax=Methylobacterium organophilum TaxID=410 RepID=UPI001F140A36|nr:glycosyltransferase family 1 protein [Methylobacterium organophilum]UMY18503.1 glycosyltransferase family 4 protein [Methylobacterium organophilum]